MKIDEKGLKQSTLKEILSAYEVYLKPKFGNDFYIKPEGVIDNITTSAGYMELSLQDQIAFLAEQFDPETAVGDWQDALYERIGVTRINDAPTVFTKRIIGTPNYVCDAEVVIIRSESTKDEFINKTGFTIGDDGTAYVQFKCIANGESIVNPTDQFVIVQAPNDITGISTEDAQEIVIGREKETDNEFRIRFRNSKAKNAKATRNANQANLLNYVDNISYLKIIDKKVDSSYEAGTVEIIAKHNTTDEEFAKAIFDTVADGIDLLGDTTKIVKDDSGEDVTITFKKAEEPEVTINSTIKVRDGYFSNTVIANAKQSVLNYITERIFGLESIVYATEFIIPILQTDGVEAVMSVEIKRENEEFVDSISFARNEVPAFSLERIVLQEVDG